ncbi:MAG: hypothetical protein IPJ19_01900 [Planctomycetes bacterium]|nr:hypothetical protein [Planctomycetota bacterium]
MLLALLFFPAIASLTSPKDPVVPARTALAGRTVHLAPVTPFDAHLDGCSRLRRTRGSLCAIGRHESFWIEGCCETCASHMSVDEPGTVLIDATSWGKHSAELRLAKDGTFRIDADLGDGWRPRPLPPELLAYTDPSLGTRSRARACIAGSGETLVFVADASIYELEQDAWKRVPIAFSQMPYTGGLNHALLDGRTLYLGSDDVLDGGLFDIDLDSGACVSASTSFPPGPSNVADIERDPRGRICVVCREARMIGAGSRVLERDGRKWREVLRTRVIPLTFVCLNAPPEPEKPLSPAEAALLPPAYFDALAFDDEGRMCVLAGSLGILRQDRDGTWSCITPGWAESGAEACDLVIDGHTAVLASGTAGVVTLDLDTLEGQRMRTRP